MPHMGWGLPIRKTDSFKWIYCGVMRRANLVRFLVRPLCHWIRKCVSINCVKRSKRIYAQPKPAQQQLLQRYSQGVNDAQQAQSLKTFEYLLVGADIEPWQPVDSLLVIYSMYLDLQAGTFARDMVLERIEQQFGTPMRRF